MERSWRQLRHLSGRFFAVLAARPPGPREQTEVAGLLRPEERRLFWDQPAADQRHGLESARRVLRAAPGRRDLARAALLHDVGKRHARLGPLGRVLASVAALARLPQRGRVAAYLDHGALGAEELAAAGAEPVVVEFARHHHAERPPAFPPEAWALLQRADAE